MSILKEKVIKGFEELFGNDYQIFTEYVEGKIVENGGRYIMDKIEYYHYCNKVNENNSAKIYIKRIKRFVETLSYFTVIVDPFEYPSNCKLINYKVIDYTGEYKPRTSLKYCIKRFCKEHEDCKVYLYKDEKLYFHIDID